MHTHREEQHNGFSAEEKRGLYRAIYERRDVRAQFRPDPIPRPVLARLLAAAHHAPSVGFMQPWDFILIDDPALREAVHQVFARENELAATNYQGEREALYRSLKLEGILESALNLCVTCDRRRGGPHVLGRNTALDTDLFSVCLAVQNLWLAARAEGIGVGWVSILDSEELADLLALPKSRLNRPLRVCQASHVCRSSSNARRHATCARLMVGTFRTCSYSACAHMATH